MQLKLILLSLLALLNIPLLCQAQGCNDLELRKKVTQVAKEEEVDEKELLSIIAHESSCHYYVIAWNLPKQPKTAQSKFFDSLEDAKDFAQELIDTGQYRVDVGIGQINNEANIKPRGWTLGEVLDSKTALNRVAQVLKAQGWANYHSSNPVYARKWRALALVALGRVMEGLDRNLKKPLTLSKGTTSKRQSALVVFNSLNTSQAEKAPCKEVPDKAQMVFSNTSRSSNSLVIFNSI